MRFNIFRFGASIKLKDSTLKIPQKYKFKFFNYENRIWLILFRIFGIGRPVNCKITICAYFMSENIFSHLKMLTFYVIYNVHTSQFSRTCIESRSKSLMICFLVISLLKKTFPNGTKSLKRFISLLVTCL